MVNIHTHRPHPDERSIVTVGLHPYDADCANGIPDCTNIGDDVDAIGEIGLDYACTVGREVQQRVFEAQLAVAEKLQLPIVVHCVRAFDAVMRTLARYRLKAVIFHGFIGSTEQMRQAVKAGCYLSFGERTFASPKTMEALRHTPHERIFVETDESDTPIAEIYRRAAEVLAIDTALLERITNENYDRIFSNR